jgi:hypothetical protein
MTTTPPTSPSAHRSAGRFARHYAEMVIAMVAGMVVLGLPLEAAMRAMGTGSAELQDRAPAVALLGMATIMTIPMVAWMRHHGHAWRPCHEMAASMFLPTLAAIVLMWSGAIGFMTAMGVEHVVMLPAMLVAMLLRVDEYACDHRHHRPALVGAAPTPAEA